MEALDKQVADSVDHDDAVAVDRRLAAETQYDPVGDPGPAAWAVQMERAFAERQFTRPCPKCRGQGARPLDARRVRSLGRKLARCKTVTDRTTIEQQIRDESKCNVCNGIGFRPAPERRGNLQRTWCDDCDGTGDDIHGDTCKRCRGLGHVCLGYTPVVTASCPRCRGTGEVLDEDVEDVCQLCRGDGYTVPVTVRSTGSSRHGDGEDAVYAKDPPSAGGKVFDPDADDIYAPHEADPAGLAPAREARDEGLVGGFETLQRVRPDLAAALALYRGVSGNRWAITNLGRVFAVWVVTGAGKRLLAEAPPELSARLGSRPLDVLAAIRDAESQAKVSNMRTRALIDKADREARRLIEDAKAALAEAVNQ